MSPADADLNTLLLPAGGPGPLVVALHGIGSRAADLAPAYGRLQSSATIALPDGPLVAGAGHAWYRLVRVGVPDGESFERALATLAGYLDGLQRSFAREKHPLILSGFSQGAILSLSFALRHPQRVAGVMAFSGYIPDLVLETVSSLADLPTPPAIFLAHGRADPLFPLRRHDETVQQLRDRGLQPEAYVHDAAHELPPVAMAAAGRWLGSHFPTPAPPSG